MKVKVVFIKDTKWGKRWEVKDVSAAMFKNILFPQKLAFKVDSSEWKNFLKKLEKNNLEHQKQIDLLKKIVQDLSVNPLIFKKKVSPKWHLYDKITPQDISEAILKKYWLKIPKDKIKLPHKIDTPGVYPVTIDWHNIKWEIKVDIQPLV